MDADVATYWFRITKEGTTYTCARSSDGKEFTDMFSYVDTDIKADRLIVDAYTGMTSGFQFTLKSLSLKGAGAVICEHQWDSGIITNKPTETDEGEIKFTCLICGATKSEIVPATNPIIAEGKCGSMGDEVCWKLQENGTLTIYGTGAIIHYYSGFAPWYGYRERINKVIIGKGVSIIGDNAFYNCEKITSVVIPDSVYEIAEGAFKNCTGLTSVTIPASVTRIGDDAFSGCCLTSVTIPGNVNFIGNDAFSGCTSLTDITFEGSAPQLGKDCFTWVNATAYYPANDPTWTAEVRNNYDGNITWIALDHDCPTLQFTDVPKSTNWAHAGIDFAVSNGLFNGISATKFGPNENMTRAMLVTVLWRLEGQPKPTGTNPFTDVRASQYYADPVVWAAENGIVNGVGNGKFNPNGNITREQLATILYRYSVMKGYDTSARADLSGFPDAKKVSSWATDSLSWANATGLITGSSVQGTAYLLPSGNATRAQVATILMRFVKSI